MKNCAFLTLDERGDFVIDDEHAVAPLEALGWLVSTLSWRQAAIPWREFDAVIIRSTWDYWNDVPAFLDTLAAIDRESRLANPLELVRWNLSKTYLRDLQEAGAGIVPTQWLNGADPAAIGRAFEDFGTDQLVIKPTVGANGEDAFRLSTADGPERLEAISRCFESRGAMIQPFMPRILDEGEFSLFYFSGRLSHAILKKPAAGEFRSQEERGAEILSVVPEERLAQRGREAMGTLTRVPLYARLDFVRDSEGDFRVMELELIEPSLYLRTEPGAPGRFAWAIDAWYADQSSET